MANGGLTSYLGGKGTAASLGFGENLPTGAAAPEAQFQSQKNVALRNAQLGRGASELFRQGRETLSAYRPGGAAALTSGLFAGQANALLAQRTQAPNLLFQYQQERARQQEEEQRNKERGSGIGGLIGGIAGAFLGGTAGAGAGSGIGGAIGGVIGGLFAEGGIILPTPGGTQMKSPGGNDMTVAEAGEPEVVAPLSKIGEVAQQYEGAQGQQAPAPQDLQPEQQGGAGPGTPPPLGRESPSQQRAGQPADQAQAQQAGMPQMGANAGFAGEAFPRNDGDPGVDGYSTVGAAHFASQRLGVPSDIINAMMTADEMEDGRMSLGASLNAQLDFLMEESEMMAMGVL